MKIKIITICIGFKCWLVDPVFFDISIQPNPHKASLYIPFI